MKAPLVAVGLTLTVACATSAGSGGALEPRYVAVHNALAAMGLAQIGPIHEGSLLQGHLVSLPIDLPAGCTTIVTIGGEGVSDVDATLLDPHGRPIAHDTTTEPQAVLRACVDAADSYTLVVKVAQGSGSWVAATWAGGAGGSAAVASLGPVASTAPLGTCASPIPLSTGTVSGSTPHGDATTTGSCGTQKPDAQETVYELDVSQRERVTIDVQARFDAVLYIRKGDCAEENAEIDCNDDVPSEANHSRLEEVLEPGKYFVFVGGDAGGFKITVTMSDAVAMSDGCHRARPLSNGAVVSASNTASTNTARASCGGGAKGPDVPWSMTLSSPSRVRLIEHSDDFVPIVHVRQACGFEESELVCADGNASSTDAVISRVFAPGAYTVFADARDADAKGAYTLGLDAVPLDGSGVAGDTCRDATSLSVRSVAGAAPPVLTVSGDTFPARDDVSGSCGGEGAADVVYRFDIPRRSRLTAQLSSEDGPPHLLVGWSGGCGGGGTEIGCGRSLDTVVEPGTYFLAVDGFRPEDFGRFDLQISAQDVSGQGAACASALPLVIGRTVGTLAGAGDNFGTSCTGGAFGAGGADRVYKLVLASHATVELSLEKTGFAAGLALRKACADAAGGAGAAEIECASGHPIAQTLEAGTYWVVVSGPSTGHRGSYVLKYGLARDDEGPQPPVRIPMPQAWP
jgi:hypothetical protein